MHIVVLKIFLVFVASLSFKTSDTFIIIIIINVTIIIVINVSFYRLKNRTDRAGSSNRRRTNNVCVCKPIIFPTNGPEFWSGKAIFSVIATYYCTQLQVQKYNKFFRRFNSLYSQKHGDS
jgi:hypothetical protein